LKVRFTPSARTQFLEALDSIRRDDPGAALRFRRRAERVLRRLASFPLSGRVIPEFPDLPFREVIVTPYRFFYRIEGKVVWVAGVWHGARIPEAGGGEDQGQGQPRKRGKRTRPAPSSAASRRMRPTSKPRRSSASRSRA